MLTETLTRNRHITPGCIVVSRNAPDDIQFRTVSVFVDDILLAELKFGERRSLEVPPGPHQVKVTNGLSRRRMQVEVESGEIVYLQAGHRFPLRNLIFIFLLAASPYQAFLFEVAREFDPESLSLPPSEGQATLE
jgi:hypothetical protein